MALHGKTILITRAAAQSGEFRQRLEARGARVLECPAIEIVPVDDWIEVDRAIANLNTYHWLIFTSTNAVDHFLQRTDLNDVHCQIPLAAVGASTARRLEHWNLKASRVPQTFRAEGLLELFPSDLKGQRILIPRAETAREILPDQLRQRGAVVDVLTVYRTVKADAGLADLRTILSVEKVDAIAFTSPSAIRFFAETLGDDLTNRLASIPIAVIGPVAREAANGVGLEPAIQPEKATIQDLIESISEFFRRL